MCAVFHDFLIVLLFTQKLSLYKDRAICVWAAIVSSRTIMVPGETSEVLFWDKNDALLLPWCGAAAYPTCLLREWYFIPTTLHFIFLGVTSNWECPFSSHVGLDLLGQILIFPNIHRYLFSFPTNEQQMPGQGLENGRNLTSWHKLHDEGHGISHYVCFLHWVCYNMHASLKFMSIFYIRLANVGMLRHEEQSHARATHSSEEAAVADKTLRKWSFQQTATASQELWLHLSQPPSFLLHLRVFETWRNDKIWKSLHFEKTQFRIGTVQIVWRDILND